jgi:hypothetical protein
MFLLRCPPKIAKADKSGVIVPQRVEIIAQDYGVFATDIEGGRFGRPRHPPK